ncbi:hypothetical protein CC1G_09665 [Coprinopsis cinerea okayama7|uniref:Uncharacterized protein n=1 Tax=Coprinopsis cinerea (strain Okayama-7 / 130 / ATCC MYA-4618 / FGSC 9003) TaxID=240176 RepID=A8P9F7_COPC7|nr:hypothetical protein CC1G_09665 [Coprinopsis cinerea okayama7\|eukprot:XP_001839762.2 hypothetical protein CC1G_09665 [Coprinopsis cinerea okayama7\
MLSRRHKAILVSLPCTVAFFYLLASTFTTSVYLQDTIHRLGPHLTYAGDGIWGIKTCFDSATGSANSARPMVKDGQYPSNGVLETTQPVPGTNGFNVFDNLYLLNGTLYVVTSNPDLFLPRDRILSRPVFPGDPNTDNQPTDKELQFVSPGKAESLFLQRPVVLSGPSMLFYDLDSFINHFYHWWGEVVLGSWRVYSALSPREGPVELLPLPQRFIMPFMSNGNWRDPPGLDAPLMRAAFPNAAIEQADYWQDLIDLQVPVVFQRAVIANRVASSSHPNNAQWFKMISSTMDVEAPENFFEPVRKRIVMNLLGDLPVIDNDGLVLSPTGMASDKPVVTYISRQGGGRRLEANAHGALLVVLEQLEEDGICELQVPRMEELTLSEQVKLAARSTRLTMDYSTLPGLTPPSGSQYPAPNWSSDYDASPVPSTDLASRVLPHASYYIELTTTLESLENVHNELEGQKEYLADIQRRLSASEKRLKNAATATRYAQLEFRMLKEHSGMDRFMAKMLGKGDKWEAKVQEQEREKGRQLKQILKTNSENEAMFKRIWNSYPEEDHLENEVRELRQTLAETTKKLQPASKAVELMDNAWSSMALCLSSIDDSIGFSRMADVATTGSNWGAASKKRKSADQAVKQLAEAERFVTQAMALFPAIRPVHATDTTDGYCFTSPKFFLGAHTSDAFHNRIKKASIYVNEVKAKLKDERALATERRDKLSEEFRMFSALLEMRERELLDLRKGIIERILQGDSRKASQKPPDLPIGPGSNF